MSTASLGRLRAREPVCTHRRSSKQAAYTNRPAADATTTIPQGERRNGLADCKGGRSRARGRPAQPCQRHACSCIQSRLWLNARSRTSTDCRSLTVKSAQRSSHVSPPWQRLGLRGSCMCSETGGAPAAEALHAACFLTRSAAACSKKLFHHFLESKYKMVSGARRLFLLHDRFLLLQRDDPAVHCEVEC